MYSANVEGSCTIRFRYRIVVAKMLRGSNDRILVVKQFLLDLQDIQRTPWCGSNETHAEVLKIWLHPHCFR